MLLSKIQARAVLLALFSILCFASQAKAQHLAWAQFKNPLVQMPADIAVNQDFVFCLNANAIQRSHLNAGGWTTLNLGPHTSEFGCMNTGDSLLTIATIDGKLVQSNDAGQHWYWRNSPQLIHSAIRLVREAGIVSLALDDSTVYRGTWADSSWTKAQSTVKLIPQSLFRGHNALYACSQAQVYRIADIDTAWHLVCDLPVGATNINALFVAGDAFVISCDNGIFRSLNAGSTWQLDPTVRDTSNTVIHMRYAAGILCCVSGGHDSLHPSKVYRSNDHGATWYLVNSYKGNAIVTEGYNNEVVVLCDNVHVIDVKPVIHDNIDLCALPNSGVLSVCAVNATSDYVVCDDEGLTRLPRNNFSFWLPTTRAPIAVTDAIYVHDRLYCCAQGSDLAVSDDTGLSWFPYSTQGLPADSTNIRLLSELNTTYIVSRNNDIYRSTDDLQTWSAIDGMQALRCWTIRDSTVVGVTFDGAVLVSRDAGISVGRHAINANYLQFVATNSAGVIYGVDTLGGRLYSSHDFGAHFDTINVPTLPASVSGFSSHKDYLYLLSSRNGFFTSRSEGREWYAFDAGLADSAFTLLRFRDSTVLLGTKYHGLYYGFEPLGYVLLDVHDDEGSSTSANPTQALRLYPNPAHQSIRSDELDPGDVLNFMDVEGRCVGTQVVQNASSISVQQLSSGVYNVVIQHANTIRHATLMIVHD